MSTDDEIDRAFRLLDHRNLILCHTVSAYPAANEDIDLMDMERLSDRYGVPVGYSGHEVGLQISIAAAARGACVIERHVTLDREMWGTDHAVSIAPDGMRRLARDVRIVESATLCRNRRLRDSEKSARGKLRR
jgi:N-acetylneuraminate synthase